MCNCYNCEKIIEELNDIIDHSHEYTDKELKHQLEPYVYQKLKKNKIMEINICPDSHQYCEIFDTEFMGDGVRSICDIPSKTVIGCYLGCIEPVYNKSVDWKYAFAYALNGYVIDGSNKDSMMSVINHSRTPNVDVDYHYHIVDGKKQCHIVFITKSFIHSGEELYIDYGNEYWKFASKYGIIEFNEDERPLKRQRKITDYFR